MIYKQTTPVPNIFFDQLLPTLSGAEIKLLLVIIRQTYGWIDKRTGKRKGRDRISHNQFKTKTGLCSKIVSKAIQSLVSKGIITISDRNGNLLHSAIERKGHPKLYFNYQPEYFLPPTSVQSSFGLVYKNAMYKTTWYLFLV